MIGISEPLNRQGTGCSVSVRNGLGTIAVLGEALNGVGTTGDTGAGVIGGRLGVERRELSLMMPLNTKFAAVVNAENIKFSLRIRNSE